MWCVVIVILVICINIEIGKNDVKCKTSRRPPEWEIAVHLAVACEVFDGVFFVLSLFPRDVLDKTMDLIESVSEGFTIYF